MKIEALQKRRLILNLSGLGVLAFGKTPAARNLGVKVRRNRQLKAEEANAINAVLHSIGLHFGQQPNDGKLLTTEDLQRVATVVNIAGLGNLAFGENSSASANFATKISLGRSLTVEESEAVMSALDRIETWIEHR